MPELIDESVNELIFLGFVRAKIQLKKMIEKGLPPEPSLQEPDESTFHYDLARVMLGFEGPFFYYDRIYFYPDKKSLPRSKEISGNPVFKNHLIRHFIYLLADDNFWLKYQEAFSYKAKYKKLDLDQLYKFDETPNIEYSDQSSAERSILLRVIYTLCGINPYIDTDITTFETKIIFELKKLESACTRIQDFLVLDPTGNSFYKALDEVLSLLKKSQRSIFGMFKIWRAVEEENPSQDMSSLLSLPEKYESLKKENMDSNYQQELMAVDLSLESIGVLLKTEKWEVLRGSRWKVEEVAVIDSIVPGGPAEKTGKINPDDKIVKITQIEESNPSAIDVVGWRLDKVVQLIRGKASTRVELELIPAKAEDFSERKFVTITREKVRLEGAAAKSRAEEIEMETKEMKEMNDYENTMVENFRKLSMELKNQITGVEVDTVIDIWGGSLKAFNRELKDRKKKGKEIIKFFIGEEDLFWSSKKKLIEINSAIAFLKSKGIDCNLKNENRKSDFSYKYINYLLMKMDLDLSLKKAKIVLKKEDISENQMQIIRI
jgi:hypothetical protein